MAEISVTKVVEEGRVYSRRTFDDGHVVTEKADPRVTHDAPASVAFGSEVTINFSMVDFDGEARTDSDGILLLDVEGTSVSLPVTGGTATLLLELQASAKVRQQPPYFGDARMEPFEIEVVTL